MRGSVLATTRICTIVALASLAAPSPSGATLIGDPIDITVILDNEPQIPGLSNTYQDLGVVVDNTVELTTADVVIHDFTGAVDVDVDGVGNLITVTTSETFGSGLADFSHVTIWLEDLDWIDGPGEIVDVSVLSDTLTQFNTAGSTLSVAWGPDSIHIEWATDGAAGTFFDIVAGGQAEFSFVASHVPEPGTLLLLGTGVLGLALYGRRKND